MYIHSSNIRYTMYVYTYNESSIANIRYIKYIDAKASIYNTTNIFYLNILL